MYAFNKRFRPTLHLGMFTILTLALGMLGLILLVFAVTCVFHLNNMILGIALCIGGFLFLYMALRDHMSQSKRRIKSSLFMGSIDRKRKRMEVING